MKPRQIRVVGAMLESEPGRFLITQRSPSASLPLLWEFPGGQVQDGETLTGALKRELLERLGLEVTIDELAMRIGHDYETYSVDFSVFHCSLTSPQSVSHERIHDHRWVTLSEMNDYQFPAADARTLAKLLNLDT